MRRAVKDGASLAMGIDHPQYRHAVGVAGPVRDALAQDLTV
jgi:hypothetical protein